MLFILTVICFCFTNIYATNFNNSTETINIYNEYDETTETMDNVFDTLSIGIIVASVVIIAGVVFFYLIPKE